MDDLPKNIFAANLIDIRRQVDFLEQAGTTRTHPFCSKHPFIRLDIFCEDCNLIICSSCLSDHEEHKCCGLNGIMKDSERLVRED